MTEEILDDLDQGEVPAEIRARLALALDVDDVKQLDVWPTILTSFLAP